MSNDTRNASGGGKAKRRTDAEEDSNSRQNNAEDYAIPPKRQRVSRACDSCRSKKDKCDGVQPVCSTCASLCRPCTYKANPKKRGLPTGYIRTLELLWGLVFKKIQGSEEVVRTLLKSANIPSRLATMGKEGEGSDTLHSSWKNSIVLKEIERLLSLLDQPDDEIEDADGRSMLSADVLEWQVPEAMLDAAEGSLSTGFSPAKTPTAIAAPRNTASHTTTTRDVSTQTQPLESSTDERHNDALLNGSKYSYRSPQSSAYVRESALRLPSNAWALFDIYFSYTQCWFPILEKHDILRTAFRYTEEDVYITFSSTGSGDHAALWAVLTLASIQEASITSIRQVTDNYDDRPDPNHLYTTARSLIPPETGFYEIGHVQALLILALVKFGQQEWTTAWILLGHAIRISRSLGLDTPSIVQSKLAEEGKPMGRAKHVFLGCFLLETLIAMQTSRVPSLRKEDLARIGPIYEDGLEEWHPWEDQTGLRPANRSRDSFHRGPLHSLSTFNRLIRLMSILNELCLLKHDSTRTLSQLEPLEHQLQLWVTALPKSYRVDLHTSPTRLAAPHTFGLEMTYESVVTALNLEFAMLQTTRGALEKPHKKCAIESSKRLLQLLQTYMETYSISATFPTCGTILKFCIPNVRHGNASHFAMDSEPGLSSKLQSFSSHLSTVWSVRETTLAGNSHNSGGPTTVTTTSESHFSSTIMPEHNGILENLAQQSSRPQVSLHGSRNDASSTDDNRRGLPTPDSFLSNSWMRVVSNIEDSSLTAPGETSETSLHPSQVNDSVPGRVRPSLSSTTKSNNGMALLPELTSPFHPSTNQFRAAYNDANLHLGALVDVDGYGPPRRPRIAPDLDALFDELASLDGAEKLDSQPEFMQNLGFIPDSGVPELYSYSSQVEPFLLAQTQQLSSADASSIVRRESQQTGVSSHSKR